MNRRTFLKRSAACGSVLTLGSGLASCSRPPREPFSLGVASGDPRPDGVVLWTRLAPDPLNGGGMPARPVDVQWQLAEDEAFHKSVRRGTAIAYPAVAHSVHVELRGLRPGTTYWYRFRTGSDISPTGKTKTAPAPSARTEGLTFAFASCQNYEHGLFTAYSQMAEDDLDLVVHVGDYIYEAEAHTSGARNHGPRECVSLRDYRNRYALYKSDAALQAAHAAFPFVVTFDDHEVEDNYAGDMPKEDSDTPLQDSFLRRRANAYRAYWEHLPLPPSAFPRGPNMSVFRRLTFGRLISLNVLDTRQYRTDQPCGDSVQVRCRAALDDAATMTGGRQQRWLFSGLRRSETRWNVIAQQTLFSQLRLDHASPGAFGMDSWDGYVAARARLTRFLSEEGVRNTVIVSGDTHASWVNQVKPDFEDPRSPVVAVELGGPSITSECLPEFAARVQRALPDNPHIRFFEGTRHGYVRCHASSDRLLAAYRVLGDVWDPDAVASTLATFEIGDGSAFLSRTG